MNAYEDLVERCHKAAKAVTPYSGSQARTRAVLAEVLRTLETVTPEMAAAAEHQVDSLRCDEQVESECYLAMLRASALSPP